MLKLSTSLVALALAVSPVLAQQALYAQCGGSGWTGGTTAAATTTVTTTKAITTTTSTTSTTAAASTSTGFVKASGTRFSLNGSPYTVVGSNAYWVGLNQYSTTDMNTAFANIAATGATTVRTWGFNEVTSASGDYYQLWSGSTATVNTGATGLGNFASKCNKAYQKFLRTNNWSDYGGMDVYVTQLLSSADHDYFYTSSTVLAAYQKYVNTFVSRYVNEPTILAWELANEPRCTGSTGYAQ
ncbi:hypothetical protein C0991_006483 [Blastosporella zonata]|nr:hypothetical protein C0991_006483 [Blastosporella zonata]